MTNARDLRLGHEVEVEDIVDPHFLALALERGYASACAAGWATTARSLEELGEPLARMAGHGDETAVFEHERALARVSLFFARVRVIALAADAAAAEATVELVREHLPPADPTERHDVPVTFWTYTPHGAQASSRSVVVPEWDEICENYSAPTRERLEPIMRDFQPAHGGQLILWHGKAGTGKTFALRALAWEWRSWCDLHYIVDPDSFFGQHADYLMSVLLQPEYATPFPYPLSYSDSTTLRVSTDAEDWDEDGDSPESPRKPWQLLILEDTGELLTADARAVIGQGLSRFLNVVDGLIGQGLRVLVLVTTNEEIRKLHPAVARPGRCAANIEFVPLNADEATAWLSRHGVAETAEAPTILASLYAKTADFDVTESERQTGFAP